MKCIRSLFSYRKYYSRLPNGKKDYLSDTEMTLFGKTTITTYYMNGQIHEQFTMKNYELNGKYITYFNFGAIERISHYKHGELHGLYKEYNYNETVKEEGFYIEGKKHGKYTKYYDDGKIDSIIHYNHGEIHGLYTVYYWSDNTLREETNYKNGKKDGTSTLYWRNGNIKNHCSYMDGKLYGDNKSYYENNQLSSYFIFENGLEKGVGYEYHDNGCLSRIVYIIDIAKYLDYRYNIFGQLIDESYVNMFISKNIKDFAYKQTQNFKEELIAAVWHPDRLERMAAVLGIDVIDYMEEL